MLFSVAYGRVQVFNPAAQTTAAATTITALQYLLITYSWQETYFHKV